MPRLIADAPATRGLSRDAGAGLSFAGGHRNRKEGRKMIDYYVTLTVVLAVAAADEGDAQERASQMVEESLNKAGARVRSVKSVSSYQP